MHKMYENHVVFALFIFDHNLANTEVMKKAHYLSEPYSILL